MRANKFANIILISGILYFVSLLIYGCYRIAYYGSNKYYLLIVIVSSAGIIVCAFALKLRQNYKINLVLMGLSALIGVYLVEIFLFWKMPLSFDNRSLFNQAQKMGVAFDTRTKGQILKELENKGVKAVPVIKTDEKTIYPLGGISSITTVHCNESGEWIIYDSDEHGFNNPKGVFANENTNILLVGDSFTHGNCVHRTENIAGQLQAMSGMKAINIGIQGNGPLKELASLKEYGEPLKPKYIFWLYYEENDLSELASEKRSPILLKYLLDDRFSQGLVNKQSEIDSLLIKRLHEEMRTGGFWVEMLNNVKSIFKFRQLRNRLTLFNSPPQPSSLFRKILEQARNITTSWNGRLYFVYLPTWERYATHVKHNTFYHRQEVLSIINSLNIPIIDIHNEVFATHPDPLSLFPFRLLAHYNAEGYRLVSQAIYQHLQQEMVK
ncbi:hypothetical protein THII_3718 [Thioploca ingrica]|uniref:SGNH hydrolase-type esterase domain-containing protein n=1 Tax=Thioploca ingrica TaxID=40754 RepID=A0A090AQQ8_9GAMM|nr:hypothetical protein THII_3718 [Thioploca ingrica]